MFDVYQQENKPVFDILISLSYACAGNYKNQSVVAHVTAKNVTCPFS